MTQQVFSEPREDIVKGSKRVSGNSTIEMVVLKRGEGINLVSEKAYGPICRNAAYYHFTHLNTSREKRVQ